MYDPKLDPAFSRPFIDLREQRVRCNVPYSYIHGGFEGTSVKFAFSFPEKEAYQGRFFHFLSPAPGPDEELASQSPKRVGMEDQLTFALTHGAYFVESNMGASSQFGQNNDPTLLYRSSAAVAEYSRQVAMELYGCERPYGYVYGGSGGGYKTCGCIENTTAFDGAVPYVTAAPVALPNVMCAGVYANRVLRDKFAAIGDALEVGSNINVYDLLNDEEREAFDEACEMGQPLECWAMLDAMTAQGGGATVVLPLVGMADPEYFVDFWTKPGYAGADPSSSANRDLLRTEGTVAAIRLPGEALDLSEENSAANAWMKGLTHYTQLPIIALEALDLSDAAYPQGLKLHFTSGAAAGRSLSVLAVEGSAVILAPGMGNMVADTLTMAQPGDHVMLDNAESIAIGYYHRHQVPDAEYTAWDRHRNEDGSPKYPQRPMQLCKGMAFAASGAEQNGDIQGKVLMLNCMADSGATTWMADWYRRKVAAQGKSGQFHLWCMEHCGHMDNAAPATDLRTPEYLGALYRALLELARWVETGEVPSPDTCYTLERNLPTVPADARTRGGVQPVLQLLANGSKRAEIKAGESVALTLEIQHPNANEFVRKIEWSFEGEPFAVGGDSAGHRYAQPGTYFVAVRVTANQSEDPFTDIQNIDRVRIVVA